ncbi:fibronectin type III domain-containing protein [Catellatospora sp. KI3]|uniref:fibronectin type III domain-containing protein n=1 Tax=Catellatospora sp. KI3 TaxID=3041620 RepID=UPI0024827284|nr:fibronectin type III domain-containing protein [Catellatospora sp. KI3]MDI1463478.1 fibronectin type III domain-containing protein [Catellatospora sp. KI3]
MKRSSGHRPSRRRWAHLLAGLLLAAGPAFVPDAAWAAVPYDWAQASSDATPARSAPGLAADQTGSPVLFGGKATSGWMNDTWRWTGTAWAKLTVAQSPSARSGAVMVYDPARRQTILFGGTGATGLLNDTWAWNGGSWTRLTPGGAPSVRQDAAAAWDAARQTIVLFGGANTVGKLQDTWTWNGTTWTQVTPSAKPLARSGAALAFDPGSASTILFGGSAATAKLQDTWRWNGTAWTQLSMTTSPSARTGAGAATSPATGQIVLFGGLATSASAETWTFGGTTWTKLTPAHAPSARDSAGLAPTADGGLLLAGGSGGAKPAAGTWLWRSVPGAPTAVTATAQDRKATVTWTAPPGGGSPVTSYTVTAAPGGASATTTSTSATVTGLQPATSYTFMVTATNVWGTGAASAPSSPVLTWGLATAPRSVTAVAGNAMATVSWQPPASDGGSAITGYTVTPYLGAAAQPTMTVGPAPTSATVTGLSNGSAYTFRVAAVTALGSGAVAESAQVVPVTVPGAPRSVTATPGDRSATVSWQPPTDDGGSGITGYTITPYAGAAAQPTVAVGPASTSATITGLTGGTAYTFTVTARNASGSGSASAPSAAVTTWDRPGAPRGVTAVPGDRRLTVGWQPPASDGGAPITGYAITTTAGGVPQSSLTTDAATTTATVTGLINGITYTVTVTAVNSLGQGPAAVATATASDRPSAPPDVTAAAAGSDRITVSWDPPASDGGSPVLEYLITPYEGTTALPSRTAAAGPVTFAGLTGSTTYTFVVAAANANGTGAEATSAPVTTPATTCPTGGATDVWTGAAGTTAWSTPENWSAGRVPTSADIACLPAGTRGSGSIAIPATALRRLAAYRAVTVTAGLSTADGADFAADAVWSGGTYTGPGITVGPSATVVVTGSVVLDGAIVLRNDGTIRVDSSTGSAEVVQPCGVPAPASWLNAGTLLFSGAGGGRVSLCSGSFTNTGTVSHPDTARDVLTAARLTSSGMLRATAGILHVYSAALSGGTVGGGAGQVLLDGPVTATSAVRFADNVWVVGDLAGAVVVPAGAVLHVGYDPAYPVEWTGAGSLTGTVSGDGTLQVGGYEFSRPGNTFASVATLYADLDIATVTLGDHTTLAAQADGTPTVIGAGTTVYVAGGVTLGRAVEVVNNGRVDITLSTYRTGGTPGLSEPCTGQTPVTWHNAGVLQFSDTIGAMVSLCRGSFTNTGSIHHPGPARAAVAAVQFTNTGTVDAQAGFLQLYSATLTAGTVGGGAGQVLLDGQVTTTSAVRFGDGVWVLGILSGDVVVPASVTLHVGYDPAYPVQTQLAGTVSGRVSGPGTLQVTGHEFHQPGYIYGSVATVAADLEVAHAILGDYADLAPQSDGTPTVIGTDTTVTITGSVTVSGAVQVVNNGLVDVTLTDYHAGLIPGIAQPCGGGQASWLNAGTLRFSDVIGGWISLCPGSFTNTGTVTHPGPARNVISAGLLRNSGDLTAQSGILQLYAADLTGGAVGGGAGQVILEGPTATTAAVDFLDNVWVIGTLAGSITVQGGTLHVGYDPAFPVASLTAGTINGRVTGPGTMRVHGREISQPGNTYRSIAKIAADLDVADVVLGEHTLLDTKPDATPTVIGAGATITLEVTPALASGLVLRNHGTLNFQTNGYFTCADCAFTNEAGGSVRLDNPDGAFTHGFLVDSGTFDNQGLIHLTGTLPGTWIWFGPHVNLTGQGRGMAVVDGLRQPAWVENLRSGTYDQRFAAALTQPGLAALAVNRVTALVNQLTGLGTGTCANVNVNLGIAGASTGVCKIIDSHDAEAVVLSVSGSLGLGVDPTRSIDASILIPDEPSVSVDGGSMLLWNQGPQGRDFDVAQADGLSLCQTKTIVVGPGITTQHCWGPSDGVPYPLDLPSAYRPGVHSEYVGVVFGSPDISANSSLSYSVTISCDRWHYLTLQTCGPSNRTAPTVPSDPAVGQTLVADPGAWAAGGTGPAFALTYHYQWLRCSTPSTSSCRAISGATARSYTPAEADAGSWLGLEVIAANGGGFSAPASAQLGGPVRTG